jgi:hypothetical protein
MRGRSYAFLALAVVGAAVVAGLFTIGGPREARREKFDLQRYDDLAFIARSLLCANRRIAHPVLPEKLDVTSLRSYCSGIEVTAAQLTDKETGAPYAYTRKGDAAFSVCATFHDAKRIATLRPRGPNASFAFDPGAGCVSGRIR